MNAYNQRRNKNPYSQTFTKYRKDEDSFTLLVKKYASKVEDKIVDILKKDKEFKEDDAKSFMKNFFSIDKKRSLEQRKEIQDCYVKGKTVKNCANELINKYYKITVVNKYQNTQKFQTDRNLAGEGEVTEVTENKTNINNKYNIYHNLASFSEFIVTEGLRDKMNPRSDEEISSAIRNMVKGMSRRELNDFFIDKVSDYDEYQYIVDYLLEKDLVNVNHMHTYSNDTALLLAVMYGEMDLVKKLMDYGANPYTTCDGLSPIELSKRTNKDIYNYLEKRSTEELFNRKIDENVDYNKFKKVSPSLLYNFLSKIGKLGINFKLDTTYVKGVRNSFNNKPYVLYMETPEINDSQIKDVFKYNKILSKFLQYIEKREYDSKSGFYIGIDNNSFIHFGLITNNMKYKIGYTKYTSNDFKKIISYIQSDKQIDLEKLSRKIVSTLYSIGNAKKIFDLHLNKYGEDIDLYISIIDNKFNIVIETLDDDIITLNYIEDMIKNYVKVSRHIEWELKKENKSNKTVYYFTLK